MHGARTGFTSSAGASVCLIRGVGTGPVFPKRPRMGLVQGAGPGLSHSRMQAVVLNACWTSEGQAVVLDACWNSKGQAIVVDTC